MERKQGGIVAFWLCRDLSAASQAGKHSQIMESALDQNVSPRATSRGGDSSTALGSLCQCLILKDFSEEIF